MQNLEMGGQPIGFIYSVGRVVVGSDVKCHKVASGLETVNVG